jgi:ATP-binding cassette subfamily B protein
MRDLGRIIKYVFKYPGFVVLSIFAMSAVVIAELAIPTFMQYVIDDAIPNENLTLLFEYSMYMVLAALFLIITGLINNYASVRVSMYATADLREELFTKIQSLSFHNIDHFKTSRLITTSTNDITRIQNFFQMAFRIVIRAPFMLVFGLIFAIQNAPELSAVFYWAIPTLLITIIIIIAIAFPYFAKVQRNVDEINKVTLETANAPRAIKSFVTQDSEADKFETANENYRRINSIANKVMGLAEPIINLIFNITFAAAIVLAIGYYKDGQLLNEFGNPSTGQLLAFTNYSMITLSGLLMFAMVLVFMSRASVSAKRIYEVLDVKVDLVNSENALTDVSLKGDIEFQNVSFGYGDNGNNVLTDISFKVNPGQTIGIIGSTGSGKSSLINLVPRIYDVTNGSIKVNGIDIREIDLDTLRSQISVVSQKATIFSGSVGTNIIQGNKAANLDDFERASEYAVANEFIKQYDDFYNHKIEQGGQNLSGGQKQRISLARAFIREPKILILDDSTSAVDAKSEETILNSIKELSSNMTTLVISQKVSTIRNMDKILVLNNKGKLDGFDTHENLLKTSEVYQEIALSQLGTGGEQDA